jgi:hypothetical protein
VDVVRDPDGDLEVDGVLEGEQLVDDDFDALAVRDGDFVLDTGDFVPVAVADNVRVLDEDEDAADDCDTEAVRDSDRVWDMGVFVADDVLLLEAVLDAEQLMDGVRDDERLVDAVFDVLAVRDGDLDRDTGVFDAVCVILFEVVRDGDRLLDTLIEVEGEGDAVGVACIGVLDVETVVLAVIDGAGVIDWDGFGEFDRESVPDAVEVSETVVLCVLEALPEEEPELGDLLGVELIEDVNVGNFDGCIDALGLDVALPLCERETELVQEFVTAAGLGVFVAVIVDATVVGGLAAHDVDTVADALITDDLVGVEVTDVRVVVDTLRLALTLPVGEMWIAVRVDVAVGVMLVVVVGDTDTAVDDGVTPCDLLADVPGLDTDFEGLGDSSIDSDTVTVQDSDVTTNDGVMEIVECFEADADTATAWDVTAEAVGNSWNDVVPVTDEVGVGVVEAQTP